MALLAKCYFRHAWVAGVVMVIPAMHASAAPLSPSTIAEYSGQRHSGTGVAVRQTGTTRVSVMGTCNRAWCPNQQHRVVREVPAISPYQGESTNKLMHRNQSSGATVAGEPIPLPARVDRRYADKPSLFSNWDWYGALTGRHAEGVPDANRVSGLPVGRVPQNPVNLGRYRNKADKTVDDLTSTNWIDEASNIDIRKVDQNAEGILSGLNRFAKGLWRNYVKPFFGEARERIPVIDDAANEVEERRSR